jgi:2-keto-3-deoxy-L-fuconate dehydrogenase
VNNYGLEGKVVLITAAGQGIGRASAVAFAEAGATVWATDINADALSRLSAEVPAIHTGILDVTNTEQVSAFAAICGPIQVLFNCAGYVHEGSILDCSEADWDFSLNLNLKSMYRTCRTFLPGMLAAGGGSIVNMSSVVSSVKAAPNRFAYATSKAAVIGLTKAIAADYVTKGIRCNALCPGTTETPSLEQRIASLGDLETARAAFVARQPMGRLGRADEIAAAALFLASDQSSFMTGQALVVDGGWSI